MSIGLRLDLRQSQQLVMTPQLQQAIKLLQMSNLELAEFVEREVEANPLLSISIGDGDAQAQPERDPEPSQDGPPAEATHAADGHADNHELAAETFDTGIENIFDTATPEIRIGVSVSASRGGGARDSDDHRTIEDRIAGTPGLREHLHRQLGLAFAPQDVIAVARYLSEELDPDGYLRSDCEQIMRDLSIGPALLDRGLALLQSCEPTGVGARSLAECFRLQLLERGDVQEPVGSILANLDVLERGGLPALCRKTGIPAEDIRSCLQVLKGLDPWPCREYEDPVLQVVEPDILLRRADWGGWTVELNSGTLPRVLVDRTFSAKIALGNCHETKSYVQDCQAKGMWLVRSMEQRAQTILKVSKEIVTQQHAFFENGISGLQPMTLRDIADAVGLHESTISRVTTGKYISTDRGMFELKFFFSNAIGSEGASVAAESVRHRIRALVAAEDCARVLSDDDIAGALSAEGVDVARRTVAKYRKSLNIPSSAQRRRSFALRTK